MVGVFVALQKLNVGPKQLVRISLLSFEDIKIQIVSV